MKYLVDDFDGITSDIAFHFNNLEKAKKFAKEKSQNDVNEKTWNVFLEHEDSSDLIIAYRGGKEDVC